jgi:hypothetical protein
MIWPFNSVDPNAPFASAKAVVAFQGKRRTLFEPNWFGEFGRRLEKARLAGLKGWPQGILLF